MFYFTSPDNSVFQTFNKLELIIINQNHKHWHGKTIQPRHSGQPHTNERETKSRADLSIRDQRSRLCTVANGKYKEMYRNERSFYRRRRILSSSSTSRLILRILCFNFNLYSSKYISFSILSILVVVKTTNHSRVSPSSHIFLIRECHNYGPSHFIIK